MPDWALAVLVAGAITGFFAAFARYRRRSTDAAGERALRAVDEDAADAVARVREWLDRMERLLGKRHPGCSQAWYALGSAQAAREPGAAAASFLRAYELARSDPAHAEYAAAAAEHAAWLQIVARAGEGFDPWDDDVPSTTGSDEAIGGDELLARALVLRGGERAAPAALAAHWMAGARVARARRKTADAIALARRAVAALDAATATGGAGPYRAASSLRATPLPGGTAGDRAADATLLLAELLYAARHVGEARGHAERLIERLDEQRHPATLFAIDRLSTACHSVDLFREALRWDTEILERQPPPEMGWAIDLDVALTHEILGDDERAERHASALIEAPPGAVGPELVARAWALLARIDLARGTTARARGLLRQALEQSPSETREWRCWEALQLAGAFYQSGDAETGRSIVDRRRAPPDAAERHLALHFFAEHGDHARARALAGELARPGTSPPRRAVDAELDRAGLAALQGDTGAAERHLDTADSIAAGTREDDREHARAWVALLLARPGEAVERYAAAAELRHATSEPDARGSALTGLTLAHLAADDLCMSNAAEQSLALAEDCYGEHEAPPPGRRAFLLAAQARLAGAQDRPSEAIEIARASIALGRRWRGLGAGHALPFAYDALVRALRATGDPAGAARAHAEALALLRELHGSDDHPRLEAWKSR